MNIPTRAHAHDRNEHGFTMMEMMAVLAILGILAAIGITSYAGVAAKRSADTQVRSSIIQIESAMSISANPNTSGLREDWQQRYVSKGLVGTVKFDGRHAGQWCVEVAEPKTKTVMFFDHFNLKSGKGECPIN